jgi:hypothetical protein
MGKRFEHRTQDTKIFTIAIILFLSTLFAVKYLGLRKAYKEAESDKVEYCRKYNEVECKYENLQDSLQRITNKYRQHK